MALLHQDYQELVKHQARIVVAGLENAAAIAAYFTKHDLLFIGLPNPRASVLKLYGQDVNLFKLGRMPEQVIVEKAGNSQICPLWTFHVGHSRKQ